MNRTHTALSALMLAATCLPATADDRFMGPSPETRDVEVRRDIVYRKSAEGSLAFDLYLPTKRAAPVPVVIFVNGIGADWMRGHAQYVGWGRAATTRGLAGIAMDSQEATVNEDVRSLIAHLDANAAGLGVDATRIALWSCSANVTRGLPLAQSLGPAIRSAVVYYGTATVPTFRRDLPLLFVRAGLDGPGLNRGLEALVARALADNAPVEVLNVASGVHGFDVRDDTEVTRATIARTLDFLAKTLTGPFSAAVQEGKTLADASAAVYREDWPAAATAYEGLVRAKPEDSLLWQRLGEARVAVANPAGAIAAFERALALGSPNRGIVSFALVNLYARGGDIDKVFIALQGMKAQLRFFAERLRTESVFTALRQDPRFEALMKDVPPPPR